MALCCLGHSESFKLTLKHLPGNSWVPRGQSVQRVSFPPDALPCPLAVKPGTGLCPLSGFLVVSQLRPSCALCQSCDPPGFPQCSAELINRTVLAGLWDGTVLFLVLPKGAHTYLTLPGLWAAAELPGCCVCLTPGSLTWDLALMVGAWTL